MCRRPGAAGGPAAVLELSGRVGGLWPSGTWTARLAGVYGGAIAWLHPDGAMLSMVQAASSLEARAILVQRGWPELLAFCRGLGQDGRLDWHSPGASLYAADSRGAARRMELSCNLEAGHDWPRLWPSLCRRWQAASPDGLSQVCAVLRRRMERAVQARPDPAAAGIHGDGQFGQAFLSRRDRADWPANLLGFGPGSTPAGDDWLAAWLLARRLRHGRLTEATWLPELAAPDRRVAEALAAGLDRTTPAGRSLLLGSLAGQPVAWLWELAAASIDFAEAVSDSSREARLALSLDLALSHGATSGMDSLAGLLAGLEPLEEA